MALSSLALWTRTFSIIIRCTLIGLECYIFFCKSSTAYWTITGLIKSSRSVNGYDYSPTVKAIIGKCAGIFIDVIIVIYLFGVFVQYMVIIYSLIEFQKLVKLSSKYEYV